MKKMYILFLISTCTLSAFSMSITPSTQVETFFDGKAALRTVKEIAGPLIHMEDGKIYHRDYVSPLYESQRGISIGDDVEVRFDEKVTIRTVVAISNDRFYMADGSIVHTAYVSKIK